MWIQYSIIFQSTCESQTDVLFICYQNYVWVIEKQHLLAIVKNRATNLDGEAGGAVEAVPGSVGRGAGVRLEGDVRPHGGTRGSRPGSGPGGAGICNDKSDYFSPV